MVALFIKHTKVIPNLVKLGLQGSSLNNVLERLSVVSLLIKQNCQGIPEYSISRRLLSCSLQALVTFLILFQNEVTSTLDIKRINVTLRPSLSLGDIFEGSVNLAILEIAPGKMLVDFEIFVIMTEGSFVGSLRLREVSKLLKQHTDLEQSIDFTAHGKVTCENRILEVPDSLIKLIGFGKNYAQLVEHL